MVASLKTTTECLRKGLQSEPPQDPIFRAGGAQGPNPNNCQACPRRTLYESLLRIEQGPVKLGQVWVATRCSATSKQRGSFSSQTLILQVSGTETTLPLSRYNVEMSKKLPTIVSNSGVCVNRRDNCANLMWSQQPSQDVSRSCKKFHAFLKKMKGFSNRGSSSVVPRAVGLAFCMQVLPV